MRSLYFFFLGDGELVVIHVEIGRARFWNRLGWKVFQIYVGARRHHVKRAAVDLNAFLRRHPVDEDARGIRMRRLVHQSKHVAAGDRTRQVFQTVDGHHRHLLLTQAVDLAILGPEGDGIVAADNPVGELPPLAGEHRLLLDEQLA